MLALLLIFENSQLGTFFCQLISDSRVILMGDSDEEQQTPTDFGKHLSFHFYRSTANSLK
jgi:hypothetical protein